MSEETDILIERKEAELLPLRSRMEELKTEFTKQTVDFAFKWYRKTAKEYITKYPEITLNMSEEKIANMKATANELVKNAEKIVRDELDNPALWWHQKPNLHDPIDQYKQVADKYPEILDHAVRHILGHLGMVLEEFGFHVTTSSNTGAYKEFWFELPIGGKQTVPCYPHLLSWTEEMQDTIREYDAQFTQAITLYNEIQQLKEEKKRQEALSRWDSI
jgi:predicted DNA binding CopG/RHH family protein